MGQQQSQGKDGPSGPSGTSGSLNGAPSLPGAQSAKSMVGVPLAGVEGFQVVRLLPYSPAHKAGLVPYFDLIVSLDHTISDVGEKSALQFFKNYVANHRDQPVCFTVFNLYLRAYRDVYVTPTDDWGGGGLLGCSIEWTRADACPERCVHVVDVLEGSPAAHCSEFSPHRDYIIGMQNTQEPLITLIEDQKDFYNRLEGWHEEQRRALERSRRFPSEVAEVSHVLLFLVYDSEANAVKEVAVEMGTNPEAALGMSVATGLLHIIPSVATSTGPLEAGASLPVMHKFVAITSEAIAPLVVPPFVAPHPSSAPQNQPSPPPPQPCLSSEAILTKDEAPPGIESPSGGRGVKEMYPVASQPLPPEATTSLSLVPLPEAPPLHDETATHARSQYHTEVPAGASTELAPKSHCEMGDGKLPTPSVSSATFMAPFNPFAHTLSYDPHPPRGVNSAPNASVALCERTGLTEVDGVAVKSQLLGLSRPDASTSLLPSKMATAVTATSKVPPSSSPSVNGVPNTVTAQPSLQESAAGPPLEGPVRLPFFNRDHMPPPLHFPLFPGVAAAKRAAP